MARTSSSPVLHHNNPLFTLNSKPSHSLFFFKSSFLHSNSLSSSNFSSPIQLHLLRQSRNSLCAPIARVSTAPVEYAPPAPEFDFDKEIARLRGLREALASCGTLVDKLRTIDSDSRVKSFFKSWRNDFGGVSLSDCDLYLLKCVVAAGQEHVLGEFGAELANGEIEIGRSYIKNALYALAEMIESWDVDGGSRGHGLKDEEKAALKSLLKMLGEVEQFYDCIGGIIGYQATVLELLAQSTHEGQTINWSEQANMLLKCQFVEIHPPSVLDLSEDMEYASQAALWGIEGLPVLGEIYPLGGSADRLGLVDPETGECLPAAMLPYCGRTLLEGLIRDLQAREFLYFKLYGGQCITPVAIMTSSAKNNHGHITYLCERFGWFGRGRSSFQIFEQPLVPAVTAEDGQWVVTRPFEPVCKPGGHGVIWKLAHDKGFLNGSRVTEEREQLLDRSAATDLTLLALAGIGLRQGKAIRFVSKLIEGYLKCVTFTRTGKEIRSLPLLMRGTLYKVLLPPEGRWMKLGFASCKRNSGATEGINVLLEKKNLDGNWAYGFSCIEYTEFDKFGITAGPLSPSGWARYLIVYNERRKVTSSAKKRRRHGKSLHQTPDGSLLDIMRNAYDILSHCEITIPKVQGNEEYVNSGPPYLILLHPALGPLWEVTRQKFHCGSIAMGSELQIEVAEFLWRNVQLDGSLLVLAENAVGAIEINENGEPIIQYGRRCARCKLENVKVRNNGIDWSSCDNVYWKHDVQRFEALKVILHGNAEFEATDVVIQGNYVFDVPDGHKMQVTSGISGSEVKRKSTMHQEDTKDCAKCAAELSVVYWVFSDSVSA
ncbi:UNVERIFIED_CONTAM: UTP--glucose-1-phosphate uridylyltransferase 3, chloroplastic [Sesamum latifolium]|uniref:UTP--glucose-1-phosphate uridylyltransferase 3, chloroplastic n=1 Tax=Sesamum latifolium TaxID=2727402 RepID=A0AAW2XIN6_9LAMI